MSGDSFWNTALRYAAHPHALGDLLKLLPQRDVAGSLRPSSVRVITLVETIGTVKVWRAVNV